MSKQNKNNIIDQLKSENTYLKKENELLKFKLSYFTLPENLNKLETIKVIRNNTTCNLPEACELVRDKNYYTFQEILKIIDNFNNKNKQGENKQWQKARKQNKK